MQPIGENKGFEWEHFNQGCIMNPSLYKEITTPLQEQLIEEEKVEAITKVVAEQRCQRLSGKDNIYTSS